MSGPLLLQQVHHCVADLLGAGVSAQVGGQGDALVEDAEAGHEFKKIRIG